MKAITRLQKTGYWVTAEDGGSYTDEAGHMWFSKPLARQIARDLRTWYEQGNRTTIKEVVTGYLPDPLQALRAELAADGWTADSPAVLDAEGERLAREERMS